MSAGEIDNLLTLLAARQRGMRNHDRMNFRIFKKLVLGRTFKQVGAPLTSAPGHAIEGAGRLLLCSREAGWAARAMSSKASERSYSCRLLATNRRQFPQIWRHPCPTRVEAWQVEEGGRPFPHPPRLLLLRADNRLDHLDMVTGRLINSIFLSQQFRFTDMTIDDERGWIVLSSVKGGAGGKHLGTTSPDILRSLLVLSTGTLEPVAHLQICRSIFGSDIFDAELMSGVLLVMRTTRMVEAHSMDQVLALSTLHDQAAEKGIPTTHRPHTRPPVLWQVRWSDHHHLEVQQAPWLYLRKRSSAKGAGDVMCLHQLASHEPVEFGEVGVDPMERDHVNFHPDDSGRVIHTSSSGLKVYSVEREDGGMYMEQVLVCRPARQKVEKVAGEERTRRGRLVKRTSNFEQEQEEATSVSYCYEDELELLVTLHSRETMEGEESRAECILTHVTEARLYDNRTLRLVKTVPLDLVATRSAQDVQGTVSVGLDLDILTVSFKSSGRTNVWVLRLLPDAEIEEEKVLSEEMEKPERRNRGRRRVLRQGVESDEDL